MMSSDTVPQKSRIPGIDDTVVTVSASIPFDYTLSPEILMADTDSTSSNASSNFNNSSGSGSCRSFEEATMNAFGSEHSKNDQDFSSFDSIPLQNMNDGSEDEKLRVEERMCSDLQYDNTAYAQSKDDNVFLEVIAQNKAIVPRPIASSMSEITIDMENTEFGQSIPPQVHIRLYRNSPTTSRRRQCDDILKHFGSEQLEQSASMPNLKSNKFRPRKPNLSKLKSRFQRSKSVPVLNVVPEEKENKSDSNPPIDSSCDSLDKKNKASPSLSARKRMFAGNKQSSTQQADVVAQHRKRVSFTLNEIGGSGNDSVMTRPTESVLDDKKVGNSENGLEDSAPSVNIHQPSSESSLETTIKISKRSHFRGGQFSTLLRKFTTVLPPDEIAEMTVIMKDAMDVLPVDNGGAIVSDILSNKMVLFDDLGFPKVTFAMENGSEPWSAVVTPDNGSMAATLKGEGCVCLWSPKGESQTDFGQDILSSPTGIVFDHLGRFVVADEENNSIYLFSRTGNYIGEFINQDSLHSFAGNKSMESLNQPRYICVSRDGLYFVSDSSNQCVKVFDEAGNILKVIGSYGRDDGQFRFPYGIAFDEETRLLYVADHFNHRVSVFSLTGTFLYHILTQTDGITRPKGLAIRDSILYVTFGSLRAGNISMYRIHANRDEGS